jgi:hypothetical protein
MITRLTVGERSLPRGPRQAAVIEVAADRRGGKLKFFDDGTIMEARAVQLNGGWRLIAEPARGQSTCSHDHHRSSGFAMPKRAHGQRAPSVPYTHNSFHPYALALGQGALARMIFTSLFRCCFATSWVAGLSDSF